MKVAETKDEARAEVDLVKEITGIIIKRAEENGWTRAALAKRAKKNSASTLYGWRNGTSKNPALLDVNAYARAVGLKIGVIPDSEPIDASVKTLSHSGAGGRVKPETADVVKIMESASDELRALIKSKVLDLITERASSPIEAGADDDRASRARTNK